MFPSLVTGLCRVRPPIVVVASDDDQTVWPRVAADDWCGEHQPKVPGAGASIETLAPMLEPFLQVADAMKDQNFASLTIFDYLDADGRPLELSNLDFANLAAGWAAVRGS